MQKWIKRLNTLSALLLLCMLLSSCAGLSYYGQAVKGQLSILAGRESVDKLLEDSGTATELRRQLEKTQDILTFAKDRGLPVGDSYQTYVDLERPFVVWNVFAARKDQVSLIQHCFPIAGCVGYKGYFAEADARAFAGELESLGFDVFVGGVAAYSTLGWFNDPLLNTFIFREDIRLAAILFHEIAHKVLYLEGDTVFNESFATAVEQHLLKDWLATRGMDQAFSSYLAAERRRGEVIDLILRTRADLASVYASDIEKNQKVLEKARFIEQLKEQYRELQARWTTGTEFASWIEQDLNNAHLAAIGAYQSQVPGFAKMLGDTQSLEAFFAAARLLSELPKSERDTALSEHRYTH